MGQFVPMVEECHLTGKDLIELDKEMLEQLGIKKFLVMKILKQIEPLRLEANLEPKYISEGDGYSDRRSASAQRKHSGYGNQSSNNRKFTTDSYRSRQDEYG